MVVIAPTPLAPTNPKVDTYTGDSATIAWTESARPDVNHISYQVGYSTDPWAEAPEVIQPGYTRDSLSTNSANNSATITGLTPGQSYRFFVRAVVLDVTGSHIVGNSTSSWASIHGDLYPLLDATMTVGCSSGVCGYWDEVGTTGAITDTTFTFRGIDYTFRRFTTDGNQIIFKAETAADADLPVADLNTLVIAIKGKEYGTGWASAYDGSRGTDGLTLTAEEEVQFQIFARRPGTILFDSYFTVEEKHEYASDGTVAYRRWGYGENPQGPPRFRLHRRLHLRL